MKWILAQKKLATFEQIKHKKIDTIYLSRLCLYFIYNDIYVYCKEDNTYYSIIYNRGQEATVVNKILEDKNVNIQNYPSIRLITENTLYLMFTFIRLIISIVD